VSYRIGRVDNSKILIVTYEGSLDLQTRLDALEEIKKIIRDENLDADLLIDVRNSTSLLSTMEEYEFGKTLAGTKELKNSLVALLRLGKGNQNQFINNVAVNRGYMLREFSSEDAAMGWLREKVVQFSKKK